MSTASSSRVPSSSRKSSANGPRRAAANPPHADGASASSSGQRTASAAQTKQSRKQKLRAVLEQSSLLLDAAATPENFASAIPELDPGISGAFRDQFLEGLKRAIAENNELLVQEHELPQRLDELDELTEEAERRAAAAEFASGEKRPKTGGAGEVDGSSDSPNDVWRPGLDIQTAMLARSNPDQESRLRALEQELEDLREGNRKRVGELRNLRSKATAKQQLANETLQALTESISALQPDPQLEKSMSDIKSGVLADLGSRS